MTALVQPIGVCRHDAAEALACAMPETGLLARGDLAALVVLPSAAPTRAARVALAGRAADLVHAFAPVAALPQPAETVEGWLVEKADGLRAALERVAGAAEWVIALPAALAPPTTAETGRAFLRARAEAARRAAESRRALALLARGITPGPRAFRVVLHGEGAELSVLTERHDADATRARLLAASAALPGASVHGPFPPYGFSAATTETRP